MNYLTGLFKGIETREKFSLKESTWYKVGGDAEIAVFPKSLKEVLKIFNTCKKKDIPFFVIGGGANVIVSDNGLPGVTLITSSLNKIYLKSNCIYAESGVSLEKLADFACNKGITGFEFLFDIPGSVGGSLIMNAGNNYGEIKNIANNIFAINRFGKVKKYGQKFAKFGYRTSIFKESSTFIFAGEFKAFNRGPKLKIKELMDNIRKERKSKFPLEFPNGGSVFKRPIGDYAGRLIELSGCGGMNVNDAEVSNKHKGFIINKGNAKASDIKNLIKKIQNIVNEKTGFTLEREQVYLPEDCN